MTSPSSIVQKAAALSREAFASRAARYDEQSIFPRENFQDLQAAGLLALKVPREYGGAGADPVTYARALLEIARGCSATALTFNMHSTVLGFIAEMGTEEQQRRYFGSVVDGGKLIASITSEPESSFRDKAVLRTIFQPRSGGYHLAGTKFFCSLGDAADYYFVSGILEGHTSAREGLLSAIISRDKAGIEILGRWNASGMRGTISHTLRYDAMVEAGEVLGGPGALLTCDLSGFAVGYAAVYLGIAQAAVDFMVDYAKTAPRRPSTELLATDSLVQRTLGEVSASVQAGRLLLEDAARAQASGDRARITLAANQAKYFCAEVGVSVTERAIRLCGGRGILKELPVERWHRDALAGPVMPPANDRCLETIGKLVCGLQAATLEFE